MPAPHSPARRSLALPQRSLLLPSSVSRRTVLKGAAGAGALTALSGSMAACAGGGSGEVSLGSNRGDDVPRKAEDAMIEAFNAKGGAQVTANVIDNEQFQENINSYLQGDPDDVFTWFAGFRARFFDDQSFIGDISDVWDEIGGNYSEAFRTASSNGDKQIFVPMYNYPWAVFYRKSLWEENGWQVPETLDDFVALCEEIQGTGVTPVALGDKDGWPAMGTFDILNMRINGYDFHISLMAGEEDWDTPEIGKVFEQWAALLPFHQEDPNGRDWQTAAQSLLNRESAMYFLGMFVSEQFPDEADLADLDFFAFPEIDSAIGAGDLDAPIDGYMMTAEPEDEEGAKEWLKFVASAEAQDIYLETTSGVIAANNEANTSNYTALQNKAVELIGNATGIAQFLDRDTRPDFASTVVIPALQDFLNDPTSIDTVLSTLQEGKTRIFAEPVS